MYKKKIFKSIERTALLLTVVSILFISLSSCGLFDLFRPEPLSKAELYENVHNDKKARDSVTRHIYEWEFPTFNTNKFASVETLVYENFYEKLPDRLSVATKCADNFLVYFYDEIDLNNSGAVTDALLKCFMASIGDPYAVYRVPAEQEVFEEDLSGGTTFVGIGVQVRKTEEAVPYISLVYKNSGAEAAGIIAGDVITSVNGVSVTELGYDAAIDLLKGEAGTRVNVGILRDGANKTFSVERKSLIQASVAYNFDEETGFAYVSILTFQESTVGEFKTVISELEKKGVTGIVFDLRSNLGGLLEAVWQMVSYLVEDGLPFVSFTTYSQKLDSMRTLTDGHKLNIPMVVLVNEYTASAAEIFTSALKDYRDHPELGASNRNVTIVGTNTFGKGVMQSSYSIGDGSSVTFTTAYYNPPSGVNYHGVGIAPDEGYEVEWSITVKDGDKQLNRAYEALMEYFAEAAA